MAARKSRWPQWFPYPSAWLKALVLYGFLRLVIYCLQVPENVVNAMMSLQNHPEEFLIFTILVILSPIALVGLTHHFIHYFITKYVPDLQEPRVKESPWLMSWWEGLYSWGVIMVSTLTLCIWIIFSIRGGYQYHVLNNSDIEFMLGFIWNTIAAGLYQTEYLVVYRR